MVKRVSLNGQCVCCDVQAARDGLLDVVQAHIDSCVSRINDVDDEGYSAMHYAARYNRVSVMEVLFAAGAGTTCVYLGAGHFGHKTFRHQNTSTVGTNLKPNHRLELCLAGIVLGPECSRLFVDLMPKYLVTRFRCRSVLRRC